MPSLDAPPDGGPHTVVALLLRVVDLPALWEQFYARPAGTHGTLHFRALFIYAMGGLLYFYLYAAREMPAEMRSLKHALRYLVPRGMRSPSFKVDIGFFLLDILGVARLVFVGLSVLVGFPLLGRFIQWLEPSRLPGLHALSGQLAQLGPVPRSGVEFLLALLGGELLDYWYHRAAHAVPLLWQFHKVHHYSRDLNPMSAVRLHPIDQMLEGQAVFFGSLFSVALFFPLSEGPSWDDSPIAVVGAYHLLHAVAVRFTHSHIPIRFGAVLDRIIVTPLVHQVHHSREVMDTNFGNTLSVWDTVFGTLYIPKRGESVNLGITEFDDRHYRGVVHAIVEPFHDAVKLIREGRAWRKAPAVEPNVVVPVSPA